MKIRATTAADQAAIAQAIAADPDHSGQPAEFFCEQIPGRAENLTVEHNGARYYARLEHCLRVHIQFEEYTHASPRQKAQTGLALREGLRWLQERAARCGYAEVIFTSQVFELVRFASVKLGFTQSPHELVYRTLTLESTSEGTLIAAHHVPTQQEGTL